VLTLARGFGHEASQPVALADLLADLVRATPGAAGRVRIETADITLEAPAGALRRILANLLENALRYGGDQPVTLRAGIADGVCRIGVLDRGPGIPPAELEAVFRPFYRLEASRSVSTGGSGLGLAIVRQLAAAQGWRVALQARTGGGLAAWLELPLQQAGQTR
jgi:two-component system osmolarity sensor histidine kinase EnvZ